MRSTIDRPSPDPGGPLRADAGAPKRLLHRLDVGGGDAVAGIAHLDPDPAFVAAGAEDNRRATVAERVLDEVDDGAADQRRAHRRWQAPA